MERKMKQYLNFVLITMVTLGMVSCTSKDDYALRKGNNNPEYEYGIFKTNIIGSEVRNDHIAGKRSYVDKSTNIKVTRSIPGKINTIFGVSYNFPPELFDKSVTVESKVTFPKMGLLNPITGKTAYEVKINDKGLVDPNDPTETLFYRFSEKWEIVPGAWKFEVYLNGKKYIQEIFEVQ